MNPRVQSIILQLGLAPHPEGGFFRETFRAAEAVQLPGRGERAASTAIYFLLPAGAFSAFHRVLSDEVWHHYAGDALELFTLDERGTLARTTLGTELERGERPQHVVPAKVFQAARPTHGREGFVLCGCTVSPGFDFADFEMPNRAAMRARYPDHARLFEELSRP